MNSLASMKNQKTIVLYFQVHQPKRLRTLRFFDIGSNRTYFDADQNKQILQRVASRCYLPANALLLKLLKKYPHIRVAFSISGTAIDQFETYAPEVMDSFRRLAETGAVDFLTETYYHSLACLMPGNEFELQVAKHQKKILRDFGVISKVFRNTELIYSDETGERISRLGFKGTLIDGVDHVLHGRSPHHLYATVSTDKLKLLARSYQLSDDIAFRYSQGHGALTAKQYLNWLDAIPADQNLIHLGMDYETFGEHHNGEQGIFQFLESLLGDMARKKLYRFMTPSEAIDQIQPTDKLSVPGYISWADQERDVSAWLGNEMQRDAFDSLIKLEADVKTLLDKSILDQ